MVRSGYRAAPARPDGREYHSDAWRLPIAAAGTVPVPPNCTRKETLMAVYSLPELPYDYAALEPHYSAEVLELHHDKHHKAYVDGANTTLEKLDKARSDDDFG